MKKILFLVCALSIFSAGFASAACVHVEKQNIDQQLELSADQNNTGNENISGSLCDIHCHNHMASVNFVQHDMSTIDNNNLLSVLSDNILTSPIYGLKRPPRT